MYKVNWNFCKFGRSVLLEIKQILVFNGICIQNKQKKPKHLKIYVINL